jgi:hypothetical protein
MTVGCPTLIYGVVKLFGKLRSAMVPHCRLVSAFPLAFEIPAGEHCRRHLAALVPARDRDTLRKAKLSFSIAALSGTSVTAAIGLSKPP